MINNFNKTIKGIRKSMLESKQKQLNLNVKYTQEDGTQITNDTISDQERLVSFIQTFNRITEENKNKKK